MITHARYYEYWSTWIEETCTRTYSCNCDSKGNCQTCSEQYDCSHCDDNIAYWEVYDNLGNSYRISEDYYNVLAKRWKCQPVFVNMHRDIETHWDCGKDGNAYDITWNNDIQTSEPAIKDVSYENKVKACRNAFNYKTITDVEASKDGLYKYPQIFWTYKQECVLGLGKLNIPKIQKDSIDHLYNFFNGYYGSQKHVHLFVCLFYNKPLEIAEKQEAYWIGGNRNELDICIGVDSVTNKLNWVKAFSWCDNKRIEIDCREDIMNLRNLDLIRAYPLIVSTVSANYVPKDFKQFDYLTLELPDWCYCLTGIFVSIVTGFTLFWGITNEYDVDQKTGMIINEDNRY